LDERKEADAAQGVYVLCRAPKDLFEADGGKTNRGVIIDCCYGRRG
jgi:hypothetical protein